MVKSSQEILTFLLKEMELGKCDLLSQLSQVASHFKGCWRNLHGLEFPSARRYSVPHAKPSDYTDAGTHEEICYLTCFTSVCQRTMPCAERNNKVSLAFIHSLATGEFLLANVKLKVCIKRIWLFREIFQIRVSWLSLRLMTNRSG